MYKPPKLIDVRGLMERTSLSRSAIEMLIANGAFRPVPIGLRKLVFDEREVTAWIEAKLAQRAAAQS